MKEVLGIDPSFTTYDEYRALLQEIRQRTDLPFYQISHNAWKMNLNRAAEKEFLKIVAEAPQPLLVAFFDLLDELMAYLGIPEPDGRLYFSCKRDHCLTLIVGQRYCVDIRTTDSSWAFMSQADLSDNPLLMEQSPTDGKPVVFYNRSLGTQLMEDYREDFFQTARRELGRSNQSGFRKNHNNAAFERAVFDKAYREQIIDHPYLTSTEKAFELNTILFGPPGTGKTYSSKSIAVEAIDGLKSADRSAVNERYHELVRQGRIQFVTFHQSTTYEDFVEGIKPVMDDDEEAGQLAYQIRDGILKRMCIEAAYEYIKLQNQGQAVVRTLDFSQRFERLLADYSEKLDQDQTVQIPLKSGGMIAVVEISSQGNFILQHQEGQRAYTVSKTRLEKLYNEIEDFDNIPNIYSYFRGIIGGSNASAYWAVLNQLYQLEVIKTEPQEAIVGYEDKRKAFERMNWDTIDTSLSVPGYCLVIDEINRGNIAAILGELITLLEADKRGGNSEYLEVILPYSKQKFSVPPNLYLLGTMNTADRSVEALDTALRRRFAFREIPPRPDLLKDVEAEGLDLEELLRVINGRIRKLLDKDHMIGHAYFLQIKDAVDPLAMLQGVLHNKILPLLQEYFYGNIGKIQLVLGRSFVDRVADTAFAFAADADWEDEDYLERTVYEVKDVMAMERQAFKAAIRKIYEPNHA